MFLSWKILISCGVNKYYIIRMSARLGKMDTLSRKSVCRVFTLQSQFRKIDVLTCKKGPFNSFIKIFFCEKKASRWRLMLSKLFFFKSEFFFNELKCAFFMHKKIDDFVTCLPEWYTCFSNLWTNYSIWWTFTDMKNTIL